jgi:transcriptional regulator with XRE-family HTH domain
MQAKKLTRSERLICHRFMALRRILGLSQKDLSAQLGLPFDRIVAVENYRTSLKLDFALRLVEKYEVNLSWLAAHKGPVFLKVDLDYRAIAMATSFTDSLADCYESSGISKQIEIKLLERFPVSEGGLTEAARRAILELSRNWAERDVPPEHLWTFVEEMRWDAERLIRGWSGGDTSSKHE